MSRHRAAQPRWGNIKPAPDSTSRWFQASEPEVELEPEPVRPRSEARADERPSEPPVSEAPRRSSRIVAIVLPELLCEIAGAALAVEKAAMVRKRKPVRKLVDAATKGPRSRTKRPLGVVMVDSIEAEPRETADTEASEKSTEAVGAQDTLDAVNTAARRYGVLEGQSIAEACGLVAKLVVRQVSRGQVQAALGRVAEMALGFGAPVAIEAPDTVWVDVTGSAHLVGGEAPLAAELAERVRVMGHAVRVAVSDGPRLAQAFARWSEPRRREADLDPAVTLVKSEETKDRIARLPISALPIDRETASWLMRLGVLCVGDLVRLPRASAASRLGRNATLVLDLCEGYDSEPLVAYEPPKVPVEETSFHDSVEGSQPLLFALRGLVARLSARLEGRGEAARVVELVLCHDRSIARLRGVPEEMRLHFELTSPLWQTEELWRVLAAKIERTRLQAPSVGVRLEAPVVTRAVQLQLDLSRGAAGLGNPENLPVLLAELASDVGRKNFGIFQLSSSHRPESKSRLAPPLESLGKKKRQRRPRKMGPKGLRKATEPFSPNRFLPRPVRLDAAIRRGASIVIDHRLYTIEGVSFLQRLDAVEWWTSGPVSRDYLRLWLRSGDHGFEAIVYVDRDTGTRYLQAIND